MCDSKQPDVINKQEASGLLSSVGIKTHFSEIPLAGSLLF